MLADALHRAHKLRHILGGQIVRLHGDEHIVRSRQGIDDQHPQRRAAVQQHIIVTSLDVLQIALEHGFPAHDIDQPHLHRRQSAVGRNEVKALGVVQNFRVLRPALVLHDGVHLLGQGIGQVVGPALTQHLREISLRVHIHQQDLPAIHNQPRTDAIDAGALADAALLVGDGDHFAICHFGFLLFVNLAARRNWTAM